jgi:hypothetical protein
MGWHYIGRFEAKEVAGRKIEDIKADRETPLRNGPNPESNREVTLDPTRDDLGPKD